MAKLINGNGNPAIYAGEDADLIASLAGNVTCIANVGNKYAATEEDANTIGLADGVIITKEGRRIQLDAGETDLFTIPTGSSGVTNYYIIGYKLVQNADSTQVAETFVQKMNSSSEIITENTFRGGATEVYVSLYRVTQVGFTIDSIDALLSKLLDSAAIKANIAQINSDLAKLSYSSEPDVKVVADGVKTLNTLLAELASSTNFGKVSLLHSKFKATNQIMNFTLQASGLFDAGCISGNYSYCYRISSGSPEALVCQIGSTTITNIGLTIPSSGAEYGIFY